jgi:uncharacterized membrane protein
MDWFSLLLGLIGGFSISALLFTIVRKDGQPEYRTILLVLIGLLVVLFIILVFLQIPKVLGI